MGFINTIKLELFKIKRTKTFLYSMSILLISLLWAVAANMNYLSKSAEPTINIIITSFTDLNTLFFPIIISIVATKICSIEHKHHTFKYLKAIGIDRGKLFESKANLLLMNLIVVILIETVCVVSTSIIYKLEINIIIVKFIFGNIIAGYLLNSLFLYMALKHQNRAITLSVGIIGGFIGIVISRAPFFIKTIIPFGLINLLSPVNVSFDKKLNSLVYLSKSGMQNCYIFYLLAGILIYYIFKNRINRKEY